LFAVLEKPIAVPVVFVENHGTEYGPAVTPESVTVPVAFAFG
jgi:hypothetical protein